MLYETLKQSYIFLGTIYFGLITGIIKNAINLIINACKNNKVITFILDLIFMIIFSFMFIICINIVNFGEFRLYLLLGYIIGFILEIKTLGFLVDFVLKKIYTFIKFIYKKLLTIKIFKRIVGYDSKQSKKLN